MLRTIIKPHPFWYRIIITLSATLSFLLLMWFVLIIRSRRRHKSILRISKMAQMTSATYRDLRYLYGDAVGLRTSFETARCTKIAQNSLKILENKVAPPFNSDRDVLAYGFLAGVCHDMRQQAVIYHEELLHLLAKTPNLSGKTNTMTLKQVFAVLSTKYSRKFATFTEFSDQIQTSGNDENRPQQQGELSLQGKDTVDSNGSVEGLTSPSLSPQKKELVDKSIVRPFLGDKLPSLCRMHEEIRYGPQRMNLSKKDWAFYADGMEEVINTVRSCVKG